jgi:hypothetical protein
MMFVLSIPPMLMKDQGLPLLLLHERPDEENPEEEESDGLWENENALEDWDVQPGIPDGDVDGETRLGCQSCCCRRNWS